MSTHVIQTEVEVEVAGGNSAFPSVEISYDYERAEPPQIDFREAVCISDAGLDPDPARVQGWAKAFLESDLGRQYANDCAELDLLGQRAAHLERTREQ